MSWQPPEGFQMVYQGGHHNIYCDGKTHLRTIGGYVGHEVKPYHDSKPFKCDCAYWQSVPWGNAK